LNMANYKATRTSFKKGHKRSPESIKKWKITVQKKKDKGEWRPPALGSKATQVAIKKRSKTRRRNSLGNRTLRKATKKGDGPYWIIMTENGRRYEHRVVMEQKLGRRLLKTEHVHHKDQNGLNNHPDNLEIVSPTRHNEIHHPGLPSGVWSKLFSKCVTCGTQSRKHAGRGHCKECYQKIRRSGQKLKK